MVIQSVPHSRPHSRTGPKPCRMRDDGESKLDQETIPAPEPSSPLPHSAFCPCSLRCGVAVSLRDCSLLSNPPFCRFAVIYHNPTFSSSYLSSPSIHRARARSNEISHIAESHLNATMGTRNPLQRSTLEAVCGISALHADAAESSLCAAQHLKPGHWTQGS